MPADRPYATTDELFETLKRTSLTTVLVEGKDDIIFYRRVEQELRMYGIDMLPAGNKDAVLELRDRLSQVKTPAKILFVVDKDLWVHSLPTDSLCPEGVITTQGYSIEKDLFEDGDLEALLESDERDQYHAERAKFSSWYALVVARNLRSKDSSFRIHPSKVLDDANFYEEQTRLYADEDYPTELLSSIERSYSRLLRGKSLMAIMQRRLSAAKRKVKYSTKQLIEIGASRKGANFQRICDLIRSALQEDIGSAS